MSFATLRSRFGLPVLLLVGTAVGISLGHEVGAVALAVAFALAWALGGFPWVFAVVVVALALGSSSYLDLKTWGIEERWIALFTLGAWPLATGRRLRIDAPRLFYAAAAVLAVLCVASVGWSVDRDITFQRAAAFAVLLWAALVVVPLHLRTPRDRLSVARTLAVLCLAGAVLALVLGVVNPSVARVREYHTANPLASVALGFEPDKGALKGWLENPNTMGLWVALLAPFLFALPRRWMTAAAFAPVLGVVLWSQSRSALLVIGVLAAVAVWHIRPRRRVVAVALVAAVGAGLAVATSSTLRSNSALGKFGRPGGAINAVTGGRSEGWDVTFDLIPAEVLHGFGFGTGERVFALSSAHQRFRYFSGGNSSSGYFQMQLEVGALGSLALVLVLVTGVAALRRRSRQHPRPLFALLVACCLLVGGVESIFTSPGSPFTIMLWSAFGLAVAGPRPPPPRPRPRVLVNASGLDAQPDGGATVLRAVLRELPRAWPTAEVLVSARGRVVRPEENGRMLEGAPRAAARRLAHDYLWLPSLVGRLTPDVVLLPNEAYAHRLEAPTVVIAQNVIYHCPGVRPVDTGPITARARSRLQFALYRFAMPRAYARADAVVAVSRFARRTLAAHAGLDRSRATVVPEGADHLDVVERRDGQARRMLLAVGPAAPYKRIDRALEALIELARDDDDLPYELVLAGGEWPGYGAVVDAAAADAGVAHRFHRLGPVPPARLAELYARAHALLALSTCESFGLPVVEAMRAGVPVVVADAPWSEETAAGAAIRVDASSGTAIATGIRALADPAEWDERAQAGREAVAGLTWAATATGIAAVAAGAIQGRPGDTDASARPARPAPGTVVWRVGRLAWIRS
jgi:glycosyltransferase involved in cell wall biosynthesis